MVNPSMAVVPYRLQQEHFSISKMKACETIPALNQSTGSTSLVLYEKRLPERSFIRGRTVETATLEESEIRDELPEGKDSVAYGPQGHLTFQ